MLTALKAQHPDTDWKQRPVRIWVAVEVDGDGDESAYLYSEGANTEFSISFLEQLWNMLRNSLCNRSWDSIDHLLDQATRWFKDSWQTPERIHWLVDDG
jgi:hypothetical protein